MENQVADTILEAKKEVMIDGTSYAMASPSIATLILFSKYVGQMPKEMLDEEFPIASLLQQADKLHFVGYALASVILGVKAFNEFEEIKIEKHKKRLFSKETYTEIVTTDKTKGEALAEKINHADIEEVLKVFFQLLKFQRFQDFFQLTTSLIELNLIKRTKMEEVGTKTTAFGQ